MVNGRTLNRPLVRSFARRRRNRPSSEEGAKERRRRTRGAVGRTDRTPGDGRPESERAVQRAYDELSHYRQSSYPPSFPPSKSLVGE